MSSGNMDDKDMRREIEDLRERIADLEDRMERVDGGPGSDGKVNIFKHLSRKATSR